MTNSPPIETTSLGRPHTIESSFIIFYISLTALLLSLAGYGGLFFLNRAQVRARDALIAQVEAKEESIRPQVIDQILELDRRIKNIKFILAGHPAPSAAFKFLELHAHPQVHFLNFNFTAGERKIDLTGEAPHYAVLAEQVSLFERAGLIERVDFNGLSVTGQGTINFKLALIVRPELLQGKSF